MLGLEASATTLGLFYYFILFSVSVYSLEWPGPHYVAQAGLELVTILCFIDYGPGLYCLI